MAVSAFAPFALLYCGYVDVYLYPAFNTVFSLCMCVSSLVSLLREQKPDLYARFCHVAAARQNGLIVLLEQVSNMGNLGAITRVCDALGIQTVHYLPTKFQEKQRYLTRGSSVGADQWLDIVPFVSTDTHFDALHAAGWHIAATSSEVPTATSIYEVDFTQPHKWVIAMGNEGRGLSETALKKADCIVTIPTYGLTQSLNVSVATAMVVGEVVRQRRDLRFLLDEVAQNALIEQLVHKYSVGRT